MPKLSTLSSEDLARWRLVSADKELVDNLFPGLSVEEGRRIILTYYKTSGDLMNAYQIENDASTVYLSPIDGVFYGVSLIDH